MTNQPEQSTEDQHDFLVTVIVEVRDVPLIIDAIQAVNIEATERIRVRSVRAERLRPSGRVMPPPPDRWWTT